MENKQTLTVLKDFKDGNLTEAFEAEGYSGLWIAGQSRTISNALARRVKQSGAIFAIPEDDAKESRPFMQPAAPVRLTTEETTEHYKQQFAGEGRMIRVICPSGFKDGTLFEEFAAIGHPPYIGKCEILYMPASLIDRCQARGGNFSAAPETMVQFEGHFQLRYSQVIEAWQAEQLAARQANIEQKAKDERNAATMEQIEKHNLLFLEAERKGNATKTKQEQELLNTLWKQVRS